jgi:hypothetical protein
MDLRVPTPLIRVCIGLAIALLAAEAAAAAPVHSRATPSFVIVGNRSIGGFHPYKMNGRLSQAIAVFGQPSTIRRRTIDGISACIANWPEIGLSMSFFPYARTCLPRRSCFNRAIVTLRRWRTAKGLRLTDSRRRLYQLYPKATARGQWRVLLMRPGLEGTYSALSAKLIRLRVAAFRVEAGSCEAFFP